MPRFIPSTAILRTQPDDRLVALARHGSDAAFAVLVERYRRPILRACRRVLPESRADDAAQQVFISAWRGLSRGDEVRDVRAWLYRIARNTALNALRSGAYDYDELSDALRPADAAQDEVERRDVVRRALAGVAMLPVRQREVLLRSAVDGASHAEIAAAMGLSEGATRQMLLRARTTLRAAVSAIVPAPVVLWAAEAPGGVAAAGAGAVLAKVGVAAIAATGAVAVPVAIHDSAGRRPARTVHVEQLAAERPAADGTAERRQVRLRATPTAEPVRTATPAAGDEHGARGHAVTTRRHRSSSGDDAPGPEDRSGPDRGPGTRAALPGDQPAEGPAQEAPSTSGGGGGGGSGHGGHGGDDSPNSGSGSDDGGHGSASRGPGPGGDDGPSDDTAGRGGSGVTDDAPGEDDSGGGGASGSGGGGSGSSGSSGSGGTDADAVIAAPAPAATATVTPASPDPGGDEDHGGGDGDGGGGDDGTDD